MSRASQSRKADFQYTRQKGRCGYCREPVIHPEVARKKYAAHGPLDAKDPVLWALQPQPKGWEGNSLYCLILHRVCTASVPGFNGSVNSRRKHKAKVAA